MLDKTKQTDLKPSEEPVVESLTTDYRRIAKRYSALLERLLRSETSLDGTSRAQREIWLLGTHVPPKYKEPVQEGLETRTLSTKFETLSEKTQVFRKGVKFTAKLVLVAVVTFIFVDLLSTLF